MKATATGPVGIVEYWVSRMESLGPEGRAVARGLSAEKVKDLLVETDSLEVMDSFVETTRDKETAWRAEAALWELMIAGNTPLPLWRCITPLWKYSEAMRRPTG
jgi:hypothetical protein